MNPSPRSGCYARLGDGYLRDLRALRVSRTERAFLDLFVGFGDNTIAAAAAGDPMTPRSVAKLRARLDVIRLRGAR